MPVTVEFIKAIFGEKTVGRYKVNRISRGRYGLRTAAEGIFIASGTAEQIADAINSRELKNAG
ncbi:MAG: hypothetical protein C4562_01110 [Actinobacteria bacterium]|nr:MAG: hypothetical protein C4562_01110 [Actinomycetota bacterium]